MNVLLIEDEPKVAEFIKKGLIENSFNVTVSYDGSTGKRIALQEDFDVIILDVMLPSINGFDLCKQLREQQVSSPILILSALGTVDDKVEGFQKGADDYLVKPFHFKELLHRLQALTRRHYKQARVSPDLSFAGITLDQDKKIARRDGKEIVLTAKEYALLELFILNNKRVLSRSFIGEKVWGNNFDSASNVVDVYINYLRNKIDKGFSEKLIHTVIGMGYIMKQE
jgi:DNA-binding response OmpR family regulator